MTRQRKQKIIKLIVEIMAFREKERYVYSAAELAAFERMRRFAARYRSGQ